MKTTITVIAILAGIFLIAVLPVILYERHIDSLYPLTENMNPYQELDQLGHRMDMRQHAMDILFIIIICLGGLKIALTVFGFIIKSKS